MLENLVLRKVVESMKNLTWEKLGPNWEGLYQVTLVEELGPTILKTWT